VSDRIRLEVHDGTVRARFRDVTIAETTAAIRLREQGLPDRFYIPRADARTQHLERSDRRTHCPFKGDATYYTVVVDGETADDAVWSYEDPIPDMRAIREYLCFDERRGVELDVE
jgi:uncharacterized protein (DUF427 family)